MLKAAILEISNMQVFVAAVLLVSWYGAVSAQTNAPGPAYNYPECATPNTTVLASYLQRNGTTLPPMPSIPTTFQVRVEANILDKKTTIVSQEYYDMINNRAALLTLSNNTMDYMIFDYNNNQLIYDVNGICYADDLKYDDNQLLFGMQTSGTPSGVPHIYSTAQALHFAKVNGLMYMGQAVVRGMRADWWRSCMYWQMLQSNFTLDYYFTAHDSQWLEPDMSPQVPLRAEIKGNQYQIKYKQFHHVYEYFDFRNSIWSDDTVFETPRGVTCAGRKQTRKVPQLSSQYSYREEIVDTMDAQIQQADVYYDYSFQLVRFDYRPGASMYPYYTTNPVSEVHDYSTGIAYCIDKILGNCTMIPIQNSSFDASVNISVNQNQSKQFYIRMKSPSQLFYLDNTSYTYEGQRTVRGVLCDVFISKRTDFSLPGYSKFSSTFEFYFLSQQWLESNNIGKQSVTQDVPIQLVISTDSSVGYRATYNIYNFDTEDPSYNRFDVRACYDQSSQKSIIIEFPGQWDSSIAQYKGQFLRAVSNQIVQKSHISHLRVQSPQFQFNPTNINVVLTLLDLPPPSAYYQKIPGMFRQMTNDKTITVSGPSDCARACNDPTQLAGCNSFDYCATNNVCGLSKSHAQDGTLTAGGAMCDHYDRTVFKDPFEVGLTTAWKTLKNVVLVGDFILNINLTTGGTQKFVAGSIDENVNRNGNRQLSTQTLINQFNVQMNKNIPGYDDSILTGIAIDDCAKACLGTQAWVCNSFTFCFNTGYCVLSKLHPDERPSVVVNEALCDLYAKKYTNDYQMVAGTTVLASTDTIYQNIYSADECAKLCSNYHGFNCKSFDYCDGISTCYLGKTHFYDIPLTDRVDAPMCNHYSRKYLADFQIAPRRLMTNKADRIIQNIGVDQCAKICVEEENINCASFSYCGNSTECRLSTASMRNVGQVTSEANMWCDIYNRQTFPDGTPYINNPQKYYKMPSSGKYTGGAMAGLAFGMILLGVLIAAGVYFGLTKFRGRSGGDGMAVSFVKEESDS